MQSMLLSEAREWTKRAAEAQRDGKASCPDLPPARLRIGKSRHHRKEQLALGRSRTPPNPFERIRSIDLQRLALFKPVVPQRRAFELNKRAGHRRKLF